MYKRIITAPHKTRDCQYDSQHASQTVTSHDVAANHFAIDMLNIDDYDGCE